MPGASPTLDPQREHTRGLAAGIAAYTIWGFFPLLFPLLKPAGALEILAHRIVWSLAAVTLAIVLARQGWAWLRPLLSWRRMTPIVIAAFLVAANWLVFIWAINSDHVVEASLGYFINPLVNIVLGVLVFAERTTRAGLTGTILAAIGVAVIAAENVMGLWVSLSLALTFGLYGVVKKKSGVPALGGLFLESAILTPLAITYLLWLPSTGTAHFGSTASLSGLLILAGVLTALPLWLFAAAAPRLPYGVVGVLQYLAPTLQFILGITVFGQHVSAAYWAGLILVWLGSVVYLRSVFARTRGVRRT